MDSENNKISNDKSPKSPQSSNPPLPNQYFMVNYLKFYVLFLVLVFPLIAFPIKYDTNFFYHVIGRIKNIHKRSHRLITTVTSTCK